MELYKTNLWDDGKWNPHPNSYSSSKYGGNPSSEKSAASDYMRKGDNKSKDASFPIFSPEAEEEKKGYMQKEDETIKAPKTASGIRHETKGKESKKDVKTIDDAIKKAIEDEKKAIVINN